MRLHLTLALITVIALAISLHYAQKHRFTFAQVEKMAMERASRKYLPLPNVLPPQMKNLTRDQEDGIFGTTPIASGEKRDCPSRSIFTM